MYRLILILKRTEWRTEGLELGKDRVLKLDFDFVLSSRQDATPCTGMYYIVPSLSLGSEFSARVSGSEFLPRVRCLCMWSPDSDTKEGSDSDSLANLLFSTGSSFATLASAEDWAVTLVAYAYPAPRHLDSHSTF